MSEEKEICASDWELVDGRRLSRLTLVLSLWEEGSREATSHVGGRVDVSDLLRVRGC